MSADPVLPDPGDMQAFNRYAYVLNNPLRYTDPTGNSADSLFQTDFGFSFGFGGPINSGLGFGFDSNSEQLFGLQELQIDVSEFDVEDFMQSVVDGLLNGEGFQGGDGRSGDELVDSIIIDRDSNGRRLGRSAENFTTGASRVILSERSRPSTRRFRDDNFSTEFQPLDNVIRTTLPGLLLGVALDIVTRTETRRIFEVQTTETQTFREVALFEINDDGSLGSEVPGTRSTRVPVGAPEVTDNGAPREIGVESRFCFLNSCGSSSDSFFERTVEDLGPIR